MDSGEQLKTLTSPELIGPNDRFGFKKPLAPYLSSNDNRNDNQNDKVNDRLNDSVNATYLVVRNNPGIQRKRISELTGKSIPTIDRHIAILVKEKLITHRDSDKTGGYYPL